MSNIIADFGAMEASAKHVENVNGQLATELGTVRTLVEGSQGNWEGAAAGSFRKVMDDYNNASQRLHSALAEIAEAIRENGKGFDSSEQANQESIMKAGNSGDLGSSLSLKA